MKRLAEKITGRLAAEWKERRRWTALERPDAIRPYYGFDAWPVSEGCVTGGIVKCLDLSARFPNDPARPNLLYLVSSALPARRELLTRAARAAGGRVVLNQNGTAYPAWAGPSWRDRNRPNAYVHARADVVIYQSEFCRRCADRFLGARSGPATVLYNPVDTERFAPAAAPPSHGRPRILVAGSHHDFLRIRPAVEVLARLRKRGTVAELRIAGRLAWSPDAAAEARQWAQDLGVADAVTITGPYAQADAPGLFRAADCLLHLQRQDACPRLVVEAMACGLPVVYSATGGTPELVGEEGGIGLPGEENFEHMAAPSVSAAAGAVERILRDRAGFASRARARAIRRFSLAPWLQKHEEIFKELACLPRR